MAVTKEFMDAVQSGKQMRVHIMLKDSLLVDPTVVQFEEMERYASEHLGSVYEDHDGEDLNYDVSAWTEDYLNQQMVAAVGNFSRERVDLLKSMVRHLYREKANKIRSDRDTTAVKGSAISQKQVGIGVTAAGALIAVGAACISQPVLAVGGGIAAAAGIALIVSDKGDN